ncbi:MAG: S24 family peptidase [Nevskia sp.]|nr:S24 family peptidase [Nevskia sp.]
MNKTPKKKSELWQRLREARTRAQLTQQDIANLFGITREAVSQWESPRPEKRTRPSIDQLKQIAKKTGAPFEDYLTNDDIDAGTDWSSPLVRGFHPDDPARDDEIRIPEDRVRFSGGNGQYAVSYEAISDSEPATYRLSWFQKERINPKKAKRFRVTGNSMEPLLFPGDSILVNLEETSVREGQVYVFRHGDQLKVKKLIPKADGSLVLRSINRDDYPDDTVPADQVADQITIIGRVRDKSGRGGL